MLDTSLGSGGPERTSDAEERAARGWRSLHEYRGGQSPMQSRRGLLLTLVTGFVAMALVVGSVFADELLGVLSKVDVEGKKITVIEKDTDKEVVVKIPDDTKAVQKKKGEDEPSLVKVDLEKL